GQHGHEPRAVLEDVERGALTPETGAPELGAGEELADGGLPLVGGEHGDRARRLLDELPGDGAAEQVRHLRAPGDAGGQAPAPRAHPSLARTAESAERPAW